MHIERFDPVADAGKIQACYEMYVAGKPADDPDGPLASLPVYTGWFSLGWDADPREAWLVPGDRPGTAAGGYLLELPAKENTHIGWLGIMVAPDRRRAGLGTLLLQHAAVRAREHGRTVLFAETRDGAPGSAFAAATGARPGITEARRIWRICRPGTWPSFAARPSRPQTATAWSPGAGRLPSSTCPGWRRWPTP
jgi:GNAT superfamily N-acetyltransferase